LTTIGNVSIAEKTPVRVMGIINVSPESFYKDSIKTTTEDIAKTARSMQYNGANIIDVGAMSTAPYLETIISVKEETLRMKQAIKVIKNNCDLPISVDTPRSAVAREAIKLGVDAINDITGLKYDEDMANIVAESKLPVVIGAYSNRSKDNSHQLSVTGRISGTIKLLKESLLIAKRFEIDNDNIIIDPSIGFFRTEGKNPFFTVIKDLPWYVRDIEVISRLKELRTCFSNPICISVSRKSFIGRLFNLKTEERLIPSLVSEIICVLNGAKVIRTHNVRETVQALVMSELIN
jgi:dihydropteroate synthase